MKNKQWGSYDGDPNDVFGGMSAAQIEQLKAQPWRMRDCDSWFQYAIQHGELKSHNGRIQLMMAEQHMLEWLDLVERAVPGDKLQGVYELQDFVSQHNKKRGAK